MARPKSTEQQKDHLKRYLSSHRVNSHQEEQDASFQRKTNNESSDNISSARNHEIKKKLLNNNSISLKTMMSREKTVQLELKKSSSSSSIHPRKLSPLSRATTSISSMKPSSVSSLSSLSKTTTKTVENRRNERRLECHLKLTVDLLPDELLLKIFGYLTPAEVMVCTSVDKRWSYLANDNVLWRKIFGKYANAKKRGKGSPQSSASATPLPKLNTPSLYWKSKCIADATKFSPTTVLSKLKKLDPFTGLPTATKAVLEKISMKWVLSCLNRDGEEIFHAYHNDQFEFAMTVSVRWFGVEIASASLSRVKTLRVYAARPVLSDSNGQFLANSPCKRSLLFEVEFGGKGGGGEMADWWATQIPVGEDDSIQLYSLTDGLLIGVWKNGRDFAFVISALHKNNLVQRSILGSNEDVYVCPMTSSHKKRHNDVDQECGLHGYSFTVELRNLRNRLWSEQFTNLFCRRKEDLSGGYANFTLIDPSRSFQRSSFEKKITLPWKTEAFHGKVEAVAVMDGTLLDEDDKVVWCFSSTVPCMKLHQDASNLYYEYDGEQAKLELNDPKKGRITMFCIWEEKTKQYFINDMRLQLSLAFINRSFGTRYD